MANFFDQFDATPAAPAAPAPQAPKANFFDQFDAPSKSVSDYVPAAISDIPTEIRGAFFENLDAIKKGLLPSGQGERGVVENLVNTGKGLIAIPGLVSAPITGTARSVLGHTQADVTQAIGEAIAPKGAKLPTNKELYEDSKSGADKAMMAAGVRPAGAPKPVTVKPPSVEQLKKAATEAYQSPEVKGLEVKPEVVKNFADSTRTALNADGIDDVVAPKTFGILAKLDKTPEGAVSVSGDNLNSLRKTLGHAAGSPDPTERLAAKRAIEALDEFMPKISRGDVITGDVEAASAKLAEARGNYAAAARSETIDKKTIQAELRAAAANSGRNVANTVRQRMADILLKPAERRGYSADELSMMESIVRGSRTQNAMRTVGNILGGGGGLGTVAAAAVGGIATGGPGAAAPLVGFTLRAIGNRLTLKQTEKLSEAIRSRSPLSSAMQKFEEKAAALHQNPTPSALSGVLIAARNFSTNLKDAGFTVSPFDLLRGAQGTVPAGAEDEQR